MDFKNRFRVNATLVSNEFIDTYMALANGEYIKEYLFLLRHEGEEVTVSMIADALNHTEADVLRALSYWKKAGVLEEAERVPEAGGRVSQSQAAVEMACSGGVIVDNASVLPSRAGKDPYEIAVPALTYVEPTASAEAAQERAGGVSAGVGVAPGGLGAGSASGRAGSTSGRAAGAGSASGRVTGAEYASGAWSGGVGAQPAAGNSPAESYSGQAAEAAERRKTAERLVYSPEQISGLAGDEDFSQLLYIAQKYMNKVFTQRECEVFAYLYDGLKMTAELLEYVVEYCVQGGHTSIRYIETVAINWHETGLKTVDEAKSYAASFTRDSFAVMKAFGLNDRKPGDTEREMIDRWFKGYGFTRELVLEACNRTLEATHSPSFKYADKILSGWKKAGVRTLDDVRKLDEEHAGRTKGKGAGTQEYKGSAGGRGRSTNQFQNFPQRDIDYDALVLQQLTEK